MEIFFRNLRKHTSGRIYASANCGESADYEDALASVEDRLPAAENELVSTEEKLSTAVDKLASIKDRLSTEIDKLSAIEGRSIATKTGLPQNAEDRLLKRTSSPRSKNYHFADKMIILRPNDNFDNGRQLLCDHHVVLCCLGCRSTKKIAVKFGKKIILSYLCGR